MAVPLSLAKMMESGKIFKNKPSSAMIIPYYQSGNAGVALIYSFKK
jgi:hypothetical protein